MSTRSTIKIYDEDDSFYIYRHYDGYPEGEDGVPATLMKALAFAWPLPRFEAMDFAAAIVRAWKNEGGGNIYFTRDHDYHYDTAYQYDITQKDNQIWIRVQSVGWKDDDDTEETRKRDTLFEGFLTDAIVHFQDPSEPKTANDNGRAGR